MQTGFKLSAFVGVAWSMLVLSVQSGFAQAPVVSGLTDEYMLDDGSGTTAADSVGGNNATLKNFGAGNSQWITGIYGGALNFTNANAYVVTNSPISTSGDFTVSFWTRLDANANSNATVLLTPEGENLINYDQGHGIGIGSVYAASPPLKDVWENYVITYSQATGATAVYRDGTLAASGTLSLSATDVPWVFGHNQDPGNTNGSLNGALDNVEFYDRAVTPTEAAELATRPPQPGVVAHLVATAESYGSQPTGQYATAETSFFVNPANTQWLAWNQFNDLRAVSDSTPGQLYLGSYTPAVDDYFVLKITNPLGQTMSVAMDQNGVLGAPIGQQAMIFGTAGLDPQVIRGDNQGNGTILNESGAFNSIFTVAGNYTFDFSFQNIGGDAGYPDVYLLAQVVPEPGTIGLLAIGAVGFGVCCLRSRRRRRN